MRKGWKKRNLTRSQLKKGWNTYLIKKIYICTNVGHGKITLIRETTLMWDCPELQPTQTGGSDVVPVEKTSIN